MGIGFGKTLLATGAVALAIYFGGGGLAGVLQGNKHPEYHYNGAIGQERVMYREENR